MRKVTNSIQCENSAHNVCLSSEWDLTPILGENNSQAVCCTCECHYTKETMRKVLGALYLA